ncbi:Calycin-like protein [Dothidotthia symphoricarpi CBS 119687]|uniref:Calycin-like protein n=1 Tax=Dothidotthia symphoricarpi CBS 119687 TaxID=1392245 RepID=A0A6A6AQ11_9PLEO|nr:Calycin-like protein [Dothidotthia symphoricarpi CBS 119687]KAF2133880.1 Calycin-like protein [Dothidotthia symphoricarpi CBS 119687]
MRVTSIFVTLISVASGLLVPRQQSSNEIGITPNVVGSQYDGSCFYPVPDSKFDLEAYLGTWYQVAGTPFGPTAGARCVTANYALNANGTVKVVNTATVGGRTIDITGNAAPVDSAYGAGGAFIVSFPGTSSPECPGPNYIVQDYAVDWAIVQTQNWNTLYILSRKRQPASAKINTWIDRAIAFGSEASAISMFNQTGCP